MSLFDLTATFGIILKTEKLLECVEFYASVLGLPVWFSKENLVCLRFGDGYLMIESGGVSHAESKSTAENPTVLRFNVYDLKKASDVLRERQVKVTVRVFEWGTIAIFNDPDGNICELADARDREFNG